MSRAAEVFELLEGASSLAIVCHDDPDPDTLASALALGQVADAADVDQVETLYGGSISNRQNRSFVDVFELELRPYSDTRRTACELVAFVDHAQPGVHNQLPSGAPLDIVIDHHPPTDPVPARVVDLRPDYGATASILVEYFQALPVALTARVASGLLFALHRERLDFVRTPTVHEYEAGKYLHEHADLGQLRALYGASFTESSAEVMAGAIENRTVRGRSLTSFVGRVASRDELIPAADYLLNLAGVDVVLVAGIVEDVVHLSARTIRAELDLGARLSTAFADVGQAGGHADMAGGQLPLAAVAGDASDDDVDAAVEAEVRRRFFDTVVGTVD